MSQPYGLEFVLGPLIFGNSHTRSAGFLQSVSSGQYFWQAHRTWILRDVLDRGTVLTTLRPSCPVNVSPSASENRAFRFQPEPGSRTPPVPLHQTLGLQIAQSGSYLYTLSQYVSFMYVEPWGKGVKTYYL